MATAFETAIDDAATTATGYIGTALPYVLSVAAAFLAIKYGRRLINRL